MSFVRECKYCKEKISFRKMPNGKWVVFDAGTNRHHSCNKRKNSAKPEQNNGYLEKFRIIKQAIREDKILLIDYHTGSTGKMNIRPVKPIALEKEYRKEKALLKAYCHLRKDVRTFRIDRIINTLLVDDPDSDLAPHQREESRPAVTTHFPQSRVTNPLPDYAHPPYCPKCGYEFEPEELDGLTSFCPECGYSYKETPSAPTRQLPSFSEPTRILPESPQPTTQLPSYSQPTRQLPSYSKPAKTFLTETQDNSKPNSIPESHFTLENPRPKEPPKKEPDSLRPPIEYCGKSYVFDSDLKKYVPYPPKSESSESNSNKSYSPVLMIISIFGFLTPVFLKFYNIIPDSSFIFITIFMVFLLFFQFTYMREEK